MKKILLKYDQFSEELSMSQALKFVSYKFPEIQFYIEGKPENVSIFKGFSQNIKVISNEEDLSEHTDKEETVKDQGNYDAIIDNTSNYSFEDTINVFKSFNKKFAIFTNDKDDFSGFLKFNDKIKQKFFLLDSDVLIDNDTLTQDENFGGTKKIEDCFYDDTSLYIVSKKYYELFNAFLLAISNYFLKRYQEKTNKTGFARFAQNLFRWGGGDEVGTLFQDLTYYFSISLKDDCIYLLIKEKYKTNDIIKGLSVLCSLLMGKFDLVNK